LFDERIHELALEEIDSMVRYNRSSILKEALPDLPNFLNRDFGLALSLFFETRAFSEATLRDLILFLKKKKESLEFENLEIDAIYAATIRKYNEKFLDIYLHSHFLSNTVGFLERLRVDKLPHELRLRLAAKFLQQHHFDSESVDDLYRADLALKEIIGAWVASPENSDSVEIEKFRGRINELWVNKLRNELSVEYLEGQTIEQLKLISKSLQEKLVSWSKDWNAEQYYTLRRIYELDVAFLELKKGIGTSGAYETKLSCLHDLLLQMQVDQVPAALYVSLIQVYISKKFFQMESAVALKNGISMLEKKVDEWPTGVDEYEYYRVLNFIDTLKKHLKQRQ
jgi:hypothetical protein